MIDVDTRAEIDRLAMRRSSLRHPDGEPTELEEVRARLRAGEGGALDFFVMRVRNELAGRIDEVKARRQLVHKRIRRYRVKHFETLFKWYRQDNRCGTADSTKYVLSGDVLSLGMKIVYRNRADSDRSDIILTSAMGGDATLFKSENASPCIDALEAIVRCIHSDFVSVYPGLLMLRLIDDPGFPRIQWTHVTMERFCSFIVTLISGLAVSELPRMYIDGTMLDLGEEAPLWSVLRKCVMAITEGYR